MIVHERLVADRTLQDIADDVGLSHEGVRWIVARAAPLWLVGLARQRVEARRRLRAFVTAPTSRACRLCGKRFTPRGAVKYCSAEHQRLANVVIRFAIASQDTKDAHQRAVARYTLAHPDQYPDYQMAYARRVLDGTAPMAGTAHGRWYIRGSETHATLLRAWYNDWPVCGRIHPDIRERLAAETGIER